MTTKHIGIHTHRLRDNPEEKRFADAWQEHNDRGKTVDYLAAPAQFDQRHVQPAADRDRVIAATIIQWLGSPVGQGFLAGLGYEKKQ